MESIGVGQIKGVPTHFCLVALHLGVLSEAEPSDSDNKQDDNVDDVEQSLLVKLATYLILASKIGITLLFVLIPCICL